MILQVSVAFAVRVVPKGRREEASRVGRDQVAVEIPEASGEDAPVALRCPGGRDLRLHGGRLWGHVADAGAEGFLGLLSGEPGPGDPLGRRVPEGEGVRPGEEGRVRFTGRDAEVSRVQACASRFLMIDGLVHASERQPRYRIGERGGRPFVEVADEVADADPLATFAPGEEWAIERTCGLGVPEGQVIGVEIPEAISAGLQERALLKAAAVALTRLGGLIAERDEATFHAYRTLRDALPPRSPRPSATDVARLLRAALEGDVGLGGHVAGILGLALDRFDASDAGLAASLAPR